MFRTILVSLQFILAVISLLMALDTKKELEKLEKKNEKMKKKK